MSRFELIAFDIDGTLVHGPNGFTVWEVLNDHFTGVPEVNRERYARYKRGELSYAEWVALDIEGWRDAGATRETIVGALSPLRLIDGATETLQKLKADGCLLFAVTGTLDLMLETLFPDHPFDEVYANHIGFNDDGTIGHWRATPFDMDGKAKLLRALAMRHGVPLARTAFVGDSSNDVWIAREAGFTVAFNPASDELVEIADVEVRSEDARDLLPHLTGSS
ncbi:MAG: HAD-IB family phosphatase [Acidobacteriota bacterium]|nr:HAD-IB family phosphatase [Acidobacteriota bacterium]MDH3783758.1 HAD-IB family phosphatase [Acidobacteriota bacterium]